MQIMNSWMKILMKEVEQNIPHLLEKRWRRKWQPTPVCLPGKLHGWRSLVGYSPWGCKESDTTEWLHFLSLYSSFQRRKWQPTPVFLPENPMDGGAWWTMGCKESDTTRQLTHILEKHELCALTPQCGLQLGTSFSHHACSRRELQEGWK